VIITDSESMTGVAPLCPQPDLHTMMHGGNPSDPYVYDECCIGPHIECGRDYAADVVAEVLTKADAEVTS
jgi:hypothetical protein